MSANDHAKVSDSGYANTYDNSQSRESDEALSPPISKKKEKEQKKKKLKTLTSLENEHEVSAQKFTWHQRDTGIYSHVSVKPEKVIKKLELETVELVDVTEPSKHNDDPKSTIPERGQTNHLDNSSLNTNEEFYTLVSLYDGLVMHSTHSFQKYLGYPKDAWLGNSFIDFIHVKDRPFFGDKLSGGYIADMGEITTSLFCRIKKYSSENSDSKSAKDQETGIDVLQNGQTTNEAALFVPFHLNLDFKYFPEHDSGEEKPQILLLMIMAQPVFSAYKAPEETIISSIFSTRHTATCHLSHVDNDITRYFGYLPQDMIGQSLFDYYHPEDVPFMKDIYEKVVKLKGSSFRSKPYRFAVQNGGYVVLETKWSSFINPWKGKLEFVIGQHRVLRGPKNPDVFQKPEKEQYNCLANLSEKVLKESQIIQDEICTLLAEKIQKPLNSNASLLTKKRSELMSFIENFMTEIRGSKVTSKLGESTAAVDRSFTEHESVMLREISPHHQDCKSELSSETPPSYHQLNYNEKIERFFDSKPLENVMYESDEEIINSNAPSHNETAKTTLNHTPTKSAANHDSDGSGSGENLSSSSNNQTSFGNMADSVNGNSNSTQFDSLNLLTLTEGLLNQHNYDMEKLLVLKHKERRSSLKTSNLEVNKNNRPKAPERPVEHEKSTEKTRGAKRASTHNRKDKLFKLSKYDDKTRKYEHMDQNAKTCNTMNANHLQPNINMWPQMTVMPPLPTNKHFNSTSAPSHQATRRSPFPQVIPLYYLSMPRIRDYPTDITTGQSSNAFQMSQHMRPNSYSPYATSPMPGVGYPPVLGAPTPAPVIYAPPMVLEVPAVLTAPSENPQPMLIPSPASQATSIKAEPGSIMAMSDSSNKLLSPGGRISSCLSIDGGDSGHVDLRKPMNLAQKSSIESSSEDSSDSSFYGSFLNTSSGSSCNPHPTGLEYSSEKVPLHIPIDPYKIYHIKNSPKMQSSLNQQCGHPMEGINMTPKLIYQYRLPPKSLEDVLKNDLKILNRFPQPPLVNDQLDQLYLDLSLEGFGSKLILADYCPLSDNNQASGSENGTAVSTQHNLTKSEMKYSKLAMIYEENAPFPPIFT